MKRILKKFVFKPRYTKTLLKYGAAGTVGAAAASAGVAALAAPFGEKKDSAREAAAFTAKVGLGLTGALIFRKHIARGVFAGSKAMGKSVGKDAKVMFRRIRGRVIPIRVGKVK